MEHQYTRAASRRSIPVERDGSVDHSGRRRTIRIEMNRTIHASDTLADSKAMVLSREALEEIFPGDGIQASPGRSKPVIWCEEEEAVIGFALYSVDVDERFWWVDVVYVRFEHRRKGICSQLLGHLMGLAMEQGAKTVACEVAKSNEPMLRVLKHFTFRRDSEDGDFLLLTRSI